MKKIKPSIAKKVEQMIQESDKLKNKKNYGKAVSKLRETLDFVRAKVKDLTERKPELERIKSIIIQTYLTQIQNEIEKSINQANQEEFVDAIETLKSSLEAAENVEEQAFKEEKIKQLKFLISENEIRILVKDGNRFLEEQDYEKALKIFEKSLNDSYALYEEDLNQPLISTIKDDIDQALSKKIRKLIDEGNSEKERDLPDEAIKLFKEALKVAGEISNDEQKDAKINTLKKHINQVEIEKLKPIVERGVMLIDEDDFTGANQIFKKAIDLVNKLYDTEEKSSEKNRILSIYTERLSPFYTNKIQPFLDKGNEIINLEDFHEQRGVLDEAIKNFKKALDTASEMIDFDYKENLLNQIRDLLNQTCNAGINPKKEKGIQLIDEGKYEKSISELYSALSIAKNMACAEEDNEEINNIKGLINEVYSAQIRATLKETNVLVEQNQFEDAMEILNQALKITNKMYITPSMEKEVENIKSLIYQTELKQLVDKGKVSEEESKYEGEIKKLEESLAYARKIEDPNKRNEEMSKIKDSIDEVHTSEIKLYLEQENQLVEQGKFDSGYEFIEKALKIHELIENPIFKHQERNNIIKELIKIAKKVLVIGQFDKTIEFCEKILDLDKNYLDAHYYIGISYNNYENYDKAIEQFKVATELDPNHIDSWNELGIAYEYKGQYDTAIESFNKAINIDPKFAVAWYNMANSFYHKKDYDQAINYYLKAVEFNSHLANAWLFMGMAYLDKKEYEKAIKNLIKAIDIKPDLGKQISPLIEDFTSLVVSIKEKLSEKFETK